MSEKQWVAHVKGGPPDEKQPYAASYEISVCYGKPDYSWGWFGPRKIRMEGGDFIDQKSRAERIAAALNAAKFDPTTGSPHQPNGDV